MTDAKSLDARDFVAWTEQQAEALRAAAHGGANLVPDWENLAEEIESLGRSDRRELRPQLHQIILMQTPRAIRSAIFDLGEHGEIAPATEQALRAARYSVDQIFGDWFPPDPAHPPARRQRTPRPGSHTR